jgi:hypothetical protein
MSGPKRGTWRIYHDPTPARLADLEQFAANQDAWLARNGSFIERFLGREALERARSAYTRVLDCVDSGDPDSGFDRYGQAWEIFNELRRQATEAKQQAHVQRQLREQQRRFAEHQLRIQRQQREDQRRLAQQRAAAEALRECQEAWQDSESQALLRRWMDPSECHRLAAALEAAAVGSPEQVQEKSRAWQNSLRTVLAAANRRAAENARAIRECRPALSTARQLLDSLNISVLTDSQRNGFSRLKRQLQTQVDEALSAENLRELRLFIAQIRELAARYQPQIKAAELEKASQVWRDALTRCGYSVVSRTGPDGAVILQASSFPMKSLNVEVRPDTKEVRLDVNGKHDHAGCVKDVQSLQAELARQGVQLTMTDWGTGKPGGVGRQLSQGLSIGGAR